MKRLGISVYPARSSTQEIHEYIDRAAEMGCTRLFSSLLPVDDPREKIKNDFLEMNRHAHDRGFEVVLDCNPSVFSKLGVSYRDLKFFKEIEADGIRLDMGFTGNEEALMTYNPQGLMVEINMSNNTHYLDTIMDYCPDPNKLIGCHNFYPHAYSGLTVDHFCACTDNFRKHGLRTAAFVTSQAPDTFGPRPIATDGLPTLEMHRHLPLHLQVEHFISMGTIDDVIISNCYPSDEELAILKDLPRNLVSLDVELIDNLPEVERSIVLDELHFNRGDVSANFLRSTQSRVKYKGHEFKVLNAPATIHRGDVVIESSEYGHYAGELQIALADMENSGKSSVVGHVPEIEHFLLDTIRPWQKFRFREVR